MNHVLFTIRFNGTKHSYTVAFGASVSNDSNRAQHVSAFAFRDFRLNFAKTAKYMRNTHDKCASESGKAISPMSDSLIIITVRTIVIITDIVANHANVLSYSQPTQNIYTSKIDFIQCVYVRIL